MGLWDCEKRSNICVIGGPEEEKKESRTKKVLKEIMAKNFQFSKMTHSTDSKS